MDSTPAYALGDYAGVPAPGRWACQVVPNGGRRYTLHLSGSLHRNWAGRLAAGLAARHISVVRASARHTSTQWTAEIKLDVLDRGVEPSAIDFIALLREHPATPWRADAVKITSFGVATVAGGVEVAIRAEDAVGFLDRILLVFASSGLFPQDMRVETRGSEVHDLFRLQTAGGDAPAAGVVAALRERLQQLVSPRRDPRRGAGRRGARSH
jgi:hypothetical protein